MVRCLHEIKAGTLWFNDPLTDNDAGPFGGYKQSGLGRELGQEGLEAFQETKHVHIESSLAPKPWWYPYAPGAPAPPEMSGAQPNSRDSFSSVLMLPRGRSRPVAMARFGSSRPANTSTQSS